MVLVVTSFADNMVLPFHLASGVFRGRLVRCGRAVADCIEPHAYPAPVARLVAETVVLGIVLASALKYEGVFTLQIQGDGPVRTLVADVTSAGMIRAVARFDETRLAALPEDASLAALVGRGHLAFTVDQGAHTERYQGIVGLEGETLAACVQTYFDVSEQVATRLLVAVAPADESQPWRASALLLQRMPAEAGGRDGEDWDDAWQTASVLMASLRSDEMLDTTLDPETLLRRPFHGADLRLAAPRPVFYGCRCSRRKVGRALLTLPQADLDDLAREGSIDVTCEFCKATYALTLQDLADLADEDPSGPA
ncbi:Hsp33 family molecular chaperone HslO [Pararhodospirillum photometricum]|uniref:Hsp33 family molecular chaperone HslO n=1 Tax=Pararhodospirillum photometricum TaxID=1084 RepID=UPI001F55DED8|nr:Hsp33 family molecular chaperone HslO [Pararhodospirillum photometricum]